MMFVQVGTDTGLLQLTEAWHLSM